MENKELIRIYYDSVAEFYDIRHGIAFEGQSYNWKKYYEPFLDSRVPAKGRILELGCGTGLYTRWLCERGLQVIAMDISPKMIEQARNRCPDADYYVGDCQDPAATLGEEIIKEGLDAIVGVNSFSYYVDKRKALGNYTRLLRRSGLLIIIDMNGHCPAFKWSEIRNHNEMREWYKVVKECNRSNMLKLLTDAGFSIEYLELFSFVPNKAGRGMVKLLSPVDAILSRLPLIDAIAIRIGVVARKPW
ncbi:MAG: class I SAM-dependent methyltransferase [Deltaproteobacteria bacterium]|nr:class I SAM-dependent methyltransferase [Deltaproteobacteria bacterium]